MRVLVSLEGPREGGTRGAIGRLGFDELHVLATEPEGEAATRVRELAERAGARVTVESVPAQDLLEAFHAIRAALDRPEPDEVAGQVNAGPDANLLSAAGLLACLHVGVPAHFVHEEGHTPLPVLTRNPLRELLDEPEHEALLALPEDGIPLEETGDHDERALNGLKRRGLVEPRDARLVATRLGRAYRDHLRRR